MWSMISLLSDNHCPLGVRSAGMAAAPVLQRVLDAARELDAATQSGDAARIRAAMAALTPGVARIQFREVPATELRGYRVFLPAAGSREADPRPCPALVRIATNPPREVSPAR